MRVLVTGARGQLGTALGKALEGHEVLALGHSDADVSDYLAIRRAVDDYLPDAVIHAAAMTDVDGCERDPDAAYRANALGTQNVALACARTGSDLVVVSTDYVFDGTKGQPYLEFDEPSPLGVYGRSKLAGERLALALNPRTYVVRTSWLFARQTRNFVNTMLRLSSVREELSVVVDEVGSPTYAPDLAAAIARLIESGRFGLYHLANEGGCSRFELAREALSVAGRQTRVLPTTAEEYAKLNPAAARRPADSRLRNLAASSSLGISLRPWKEALAEMLLPTRYGTA
jgi:dTDP-4-dehydrorhamnose reductase